MRTALAVFGFALILWGTRLAWTGRGLPRFERRRYSPRIVVDRVAVGWYHGEASGPWIPDAFTLKVGRLFAYVTGR